MRRSVLVYNYHDLVYVPAHPRRRRYRHPAWLGPNPKSLDPRIKCASDPLPLIQEVVTPPGTSESLIQAS